MSYRGNWSDGRSAARHEVTVDVTDDALVLHALDGTSLARWEFGELVLLDEPVPGTLRLGRTVTPDARLVVGDPAFVLTVSRGRAEMRLQLADVSSPFLGSAITLFETAVAQALKAPDINLGDEDL